MVSDHWREVASGANSSRLCLLPFVLIAGSAGTSQVDFPPWPLFPLALPSLVVFVLAPAFAERKTLQGPCEGDLQI